jgi:diacylglycerol kinase family enzyme
MTTRELLVVAEAEASPARRRGLETALEVLRAAGPVEVVRTRSLAELDAAADTSPGRPLVVCGGDGGLHCVVARLWRRGLLDDAVVGLIPLGTGNDLARGLGIPLDPADAAAALVAGEPHRLDLLVDDDDGVVVNAVHAGLGARAATVASGMKQHLGPLAYPVGALVAGVCEQGWALDVEVDGRPLVARDDGPLLMVGACNGPSIGGGTHLCPGADSGDGVLDVVAVAATGPAARVAFSAALLRGTHLDRADVHHVRGHEVIISGDPVPHNADGELSDEVARRSYRLVPAAWSLLLAA